MEAHLRILPTLFFFSILSFAGAQTKPTGKLDLYILIGQSNMAGRGPITSEMKNEGNGHVFMFTRDSQWVEARHPLHFDKPKAAAAGPGLAFGIKMAEANPRAEIGLIPCAVGGTAIEKWVPGAYDQSTGTHPYDDAADRIKAAMQYGTFRGIIWHQGESNSGSEARAQGYLDKLIVLINRMRELTGNPQLPFVAGELGRYRDNFQLINKQLALLPSKVKYTALALSDGLVHKGDTLHFDGKSADELGKRMAVQMLVLQKKLTAKSH
jgi:hypothetical protein